MKVGCVIGFPHGNSSTAVKVFETEQICNNCAVEIDMVKEGVRRSERGERGEV